MLTGLVLVSETPMATYVKTRFTHSTLERYWSVRTQRNLKPCIGLHSVDVEGLEILLGLVQDRCIDPTVTNHWIDRILKHNGDHLPHALIRVGTFPLSNDDIFNLGSLDPRPSSHANFSHGHR